MPRHRKGVVALLVLFVAFSFTWTPVPRGTVMAAHVVAKKKCKTVIKKGKKTKVCKKARASKRAAKPTSTPRSTPTPTATATPIPKLPPLNVAPQPDTAHAVTKEILTDQGGTITATGADGTTFTLTIPKNALAIDTAITMTPVSSLQGVTFSDGVVEAVQLTPDGLSFLQPASLTITPAHAIPVNRQIPFAYQGQGQHLHLALLTKDTSKITFPILHFTGYGVGGGSSGDSAGIAQHSAGATKDDYDAQVAEILQEARNGTISEDDAFAQARKVLDQEYQDVVVSAMEEAAVGPEEDVNAGIQTALGWAREYELLGGGDQWNTILPGMQKAMNHEWQDIISPELDKATSGTQDEAADTIKRALEFAREAELLGIHMEDTVFEKVTAIIQHFYDQSGDKCRSDRGAAVGYDPTVGWLLDVPDDIKNRLELARDLALLGSHAADDLNQVLSACRPHGFKFDSVTFSQVDTEGDTPTTVTDTFSGHTCGTTPWTSWTINVGRQVVSGDSSAASSGDKSVSVPQGGPGTIFSGYGAGAQVLVLAQNPGLMRVTELPMPHFTMEVTQQDRPLMDDLSCK